MSQSLIWHVIRDNNSFLVKRERTRSGAVQFSSEPGNLLNAHCFKYSGIANNNAVDVSSTLLLRTKDSKATNKPSKTYNAGETLSHRFPSKAIAKTIAVVEATRPDLLTAAKIRVEKTLRGVRRANGIRGRKHTKAVKKVTEQENCPYNERLREANSAAIQAAACAALATGLKGASLLAHIDSAPLKPTGAALLKALLYQLSNVTGTKWWVKEEYGAALKGLLAGSMKEEVAALYAVQEYCHNKNFPDGDFMGKPHKLIDALFDLLMCGLVKPEAVLAWADDANAGNVGGREEAIAQTAGTVKAIREAEPIVLIGGGKFHEVKPGKRTQCLPVLRFTTSDLSWQSELLKLDPAAHSIIQLIEDTANRMEIKDSIVAVKQGVELSHVAAKRLHNLCRDIRGQAARVPPMVGTADFAYRFTVVQATNAAMCMMFIRKDIPQRNPNHASGKPFLLAVPEICESTGANDAASVASSGTAWRVYEISPFEKQVQIMRGGAVVEQEFECE